MKVIFVALALFAVAHAFPSEQDNDQKSYSQSNSEINVHQDWESKLKIFFNRAKDYLGSKSENQNKEGPHGQNENDQAKPLENKDNEDPHGQNEHDKPKDKEDSHDKDQNNKDKDDWESKLKHALNEVKNYFSSSHDGKQDNNKGKDEHDYQKNY